MANTPDYVKRFQQSRTERANFEFRWQQVADYISPSQDFTVKRTPGTDRSAFIYDITARNANEMLIAGLHGLLTSPYMQWFGLTSKDLITVDDEQYLSALEKYLYHDIFSDTRTMFNTQMHEFYRDLVTYGTGILQIKFNEADRQIQFRARPLSTCYIQENEQGVVDTIYRYATMPIKQVLELYQTPKLTELGRTNPMAKVQILQYCAPRTDVKTYPGGVNKSKPFKNCFYDLTHAEELEESGYDYFPFIVTRFQKRTGEIYGDSPALEALPAVKGLNVVNEFGIRGLMKAVDPAMQVVDDSILGNSPITQNPGSIIYTRPGSEVKYLLSNYNPTFAIEFIEYLRRDVMRMFHADWFDTPVQPNMTATEFLQRQQEGMRRLSPMLSRIEQEGLSKIIETVIQIAAIHKLFPMRAGLKYDIHYTSPIAQAQAAVEANSLTQTFALYGQLFQLTQSTDPIKHLNLDAIARDVPLHVFKLRPEWMNSQEQVQAIEQAAQQQQSQIQQLQAAQAAASAAKDAGMAAKAFSQSTNPPTGNR